MLAVLGDEYIAQHVRQCIAQEEKERLFRRYVTDALYCISRGNEAMSVKWSDIDTGWQKPEPERDPEKMQEKFLKDLNGEEEEDESIYPGG